MKKIITLLLTLTVIFTLAACAGNTETPEGSTDNSSSNPVADAVLSDGTLDTGMKEKFDQIEYSAYVDLFYNDNGASYEGKRFQKDGTFAILKDAYSDVTRYYVWGYADNTKCCDYQWEIVLNDGATIPEPGSYVKVDGTMKANENALDGYWLEDVTLTVTEEFANQGFDMDMTTMSPTLVRVQIINILQHKDKFVDLSVRIFGRALSTNTIQHPYYNESWTLHFSEDETVPAIGEYMLLEGIYNASGSDNIVETSKITLIGK